MDLATVQFLRTKAARLSPSKEEAEDLVQDVLLIALETGRSDRPWLSGVIKRQAAMQARSAVRRRRREANSERSQAGSEASTSVDPGELLKQLPPAARRVAVLALHGLNSKEICWLLDLTPTAFRQRLTSIRKSLGNLAEKQQAEALALAYVRDPARTVDLQFGLVRRALKAALIDQLGNNGPQAAGKSGDKLGTHDLDGHLLVISNRKDH